VVLERLPEHDELLEQALYPRLAERGELAAYVTDHRYYSVGSPERLPVTERFLARRPAVILDRDGVLNRRPPRAEYVRRPDEFDWLPGARQALALLKEAGYAVIVVSNQAGIARGAMTEGDLDAVHARMRAEAADAGGGVNAIYHCPHGWNEGCDCRKPKPGMLFQAQRDFELDLTRTPFIGDDERDRQAADAAGCPSVLVSERLTLLDAVQSLIADRAQAVAP
jgi:histidinol-phosphate phosphatase family protein